MLLSLAQNERRTEQKLSLGKVLAASGQRPFIVKAQVTSHFLLSDVCQHVGKPHLVNMSESRIFDLVWSVETCRKAELMLPGSSKGRHRNRRKLCIVTKVHSRKLQVSSFAESCIKI